MTLPPIDDWWTQLSDGAREAVLESGSPLLGDAVREEIREITGAVVGMAEALTDEDLDYARKHGEPAD